YAHRARPARLLRAASGRLALAGIAAADLRRAAGRPRLPRGLHPGGLHRDGGAGTVVLPAAPRGARSVIPLAIVGLYLVTVVYVGIFAFRRAERRAGAEDFFL